MLLLEHRLQPPAHVPHVHRTVRGAGRQLRAVAAERDTRPIAAHPKVIVAERAHRLIHAQVHQLDRIVAHATDQMLAVARQVQRRDLALQLDIVGRALGARVPEANLLVVVAANDGRTGAVRCHQIVTTGAGEFRRDAGATAQVPDLERAIVRAGNDFARLAEEFRRHHFATVPGERVLRA